MGQRPSFAIQELLGLSGTQYGAAAASQAAAAQGFPASQFFSAAATANDPSGAGVSPPGMGSPYSYHHPHSHHPQNFVSNASMVTAATSMVTAQTADMPDFSAGMSSVYGPAWRGHPAGFLSGFSGGRGGDDGGQVRAGSAGSIGGGGHHHQHHHHHHHAALHGGVDHLGGSDKQHHLLHQQGRLKLDLNLDHIYMFIYG